MRWFVLNAIVTLVTSGDGVWTSLTVESKQKSVDVQIADSGTTLRLRIRPGETQRISLPVGRWRWRNAEGDWPTGVSFMVGV